MEEWRNINGYPGYQVSNLGRVRTHNKVTRSARFGRRVWRDRILKQKHSFKDNSYRVDLWNNDGHRSWLVHRLVANAFLGESDGLTVNHKDGDRRNNRLDNLEWLSLADNIRHGFENGLYSSQMRCSLISPDGETHEFRSMAEASRWLGRNTGYVSLARQKQRLTVSDISGQIYRLGEVNEDEQRE